MKFGKLKDVSQVDFSLPADPPANAARLASYPAERDRPAELRGHRPISEANNVLIGATGWSMKAWVGKWYPPKTKAADYLHYYGQLFNTIELNTTHYRIPSQEQVRKWAAQVPDDFRFCPKLPQKISHVNGLGLGTSVIAEVARSMDAFEEKLGCCFMPLPPYFSADRLPLLEKFLATWPSILPLAIEVRHHSWYSDAAQLTAFLDVLAKHQATAVITDVAGRRDVLHMGLSAPRTMIRFVGNGLIASDYERLKSWTERLRQWNLPEVYFFPHQPDNILAPEAASWLAGELQKSNWAVTRGPQLYEEPPEDQLSLF